MATATRSKKSTTTRKGNTTASAKKVQDSKPDVLTATIEATVIEAIPFVRGKFEKDGSLNTDGPRTPGGVCFSEVDDKGKQAKTPVLRQVYISQAQDNKADKPQDVTLLLVVA